MEVVASAPNSPPLTLSLSSCCWCRAAVPSDHTRVLRKLAAEFGEDRLPDRGRSGFPAFADVSISSPIKTLVGAASKGGRWYLKVFSGDDGDNAAVESILCESVVADE